MGKEKFNHWAQLGDMTAEEAMRQYINKMIEMDVGWEPTRKYSAGFGLRPSTMADIDSSEVIALYRILVVTKAAFSI